jgi:hypothetical protein
VLYEPDNAVLGLVLETDEFKVLSYKGVVCKCVCVCPQNLKGRLWPHLKVASSN